MPRYTSFRPRGRSNAAANGQNNKGPAGLVERPADLKERTGELPPVDIEMAAEELKKPLTKN